MTAESSSYGDAMADGYDEWFTVPDDGDDAAQFLAALAGRSRALEFGIGTGRVALPLQSRGVEVHGIDASSEMVDQLRRKPGGECLKVHIGNFATLDSGEKYGLIYMVYGTFYLLLSQEDQIRCLENARRQLAEDGCVVIQVHAPKSGSIGLAQRINVDHVGNDRVVLDVALHDQVQQRVDSQSVVISEAGTRLIPVSYRYVWPSEMDLMARIAGLRLRERWGGWGREKFSSASHWNVSVYEVVP